MDQNGKLDGRVDGLSVSPHAQQSRLAEIRLTGMDSTSVGRLGKANFDFGLLLSASVAAEYKFRFRYK